MKQGMQSYKKLLSDVERHDIASLYLLGGSERFIMERMAERIVSAAVPEDLRAFNLTIAYGSEIDAAEFVSAASSFPFLADRRVLVLKETEKLRGAAGPIVDYCEKPSPTSTVIFLYCPFDEDGGRLRETRDLARLLEVLRRNGRESVFERLTDAELLQWLRQTARALGFDLDPEAADALVRSAGDNLFDLRGELEKLGLLFEGRTVRPQDLAAVIGRYRLNALYDLVDGIAPGEERRSIALLERILRSGAERPSTILYLVTRRLLAMLKLRLGAGSRGYVPDRLRRQAQAFGERELVVWLENARRAELLLKTSSFPEETLLVSAFAHAFRGRCIEQPYTTS